MQDFIVIFLIYFIFRLHAQMNDEMMSHQTVPFCRADIRPV